MNRTSGPPLNTIERGGWRQFTPSQLLLLPVLLAAAIWLFLPTMQFGFLGWDDRQNILDNPAVIGESVKPAWLAPWFGFYNPVVQSVWRVVFASGGGSAVPFRWLNLALHLANVLLVYVLAMRLLREHSGQDDAKSASNAIVSFLAAVLFALHPLQVGSVAWISGSRDLLAASFALAALLVLIRDAVPKAISESTVSTIVRVAIASLLFAASLLCKPSGAALPAIVALLSYTMPHALRLSRRATFWLTAVWGAAIAVVIRVTYEVQSDLTPLTVPFAQRVMGAFDAIGFYVIKFVWPTQLSIDYGRTPSAVWNGGLTPSMLLCATVGAGAVIAIAISVWRFRRAHAPAMFSVGLLALSPVLGIVPFSFQRISTVTDHYAYLPLVFVAIGCGSLARAVHRTSSRFRGDVTTAPWAVAAIATAVTVVLLVVSSSRVTAWRSDEALFADALSKNANSVPALVSVAKTSCDNGRYLEGITFAHRALGLDSTSPTALANVAVCYFRDNQPEKVIALLPIIVTPKAVYNLDRDNTPTSSLMNSMAGAFFATDRPKTGWLLLCYAAALRPTNVMLQENLRDMADAVVAAGGRAECGPATGVVPLVEALEAVGEDATRE